MRNPILSRLLLGSALAAALALGVVALRAALPTPQGHAVPVQTAPVPDAPAATTFDVSDPSPVADAMIGPALPIAEEPKVEAEALPIKDVAPCASEHRASSCPDASASGDARGATASRPTVAVDGERSSSSSSNARTSRADRRVSSGPMRMLGGGESTW